MQTHVCLCNSTVCVCMWVSKCLSKGSIFYYFINIFPKFNIQWIRSNVTKNGTRKKNYIKIKSIICTRINVTYHARIKIKLEYLRAPPNESRKSATQNREYIEHSLCEKLINASMIILLVFFCYYFSSFDRFRFVFFLFSFYSLLVGVPNMAFLFKFCCKLE